MDHAPIALIFFQGYRDFGTIIIFIFINRHSEISRPYSLSFGRKHQKKECINYGGKNHIEL